MNINSSVKTTSPKALILPLCLFLIVSGSYYSTLVAIGIEWTGNGPYSHGLLVMFVVAHIVWHERDLLSEYQQSPQLVGLLTMFVGGVAWFLASAINVQVVQLVGFFLLLVGAVYTMFGWRKTWKLRIPILSIILVFPIWNLLQIPLQELSSDISHIGLKALEIPTLREGFRFTVPGGLFIVEEACSGLGFFLCSGSLAVLFLHYNQIGGVKSILFIVFALVLALISNWLRIIVIMVVGNYTRMDHPIVQDHLTFGWILFAIMLVPFFVVGNLLSDETAAVEPKADVPSASQPGNPIVVMLTIGILTLFPILDWILSIQNQGEQDFHLLAKEMESVIGPVRQEGIPNWKSQFSGASNVYGRSYGGTGKGVMSLVVYYDEQHQGSELIYVNNSLFSEERWREVGSEDCKLQSVKGEAVYNHYCLSGPNRVTRTIIYWYEIGGRTTAGALEAKFFELLGILSGDRSANLIALASDSARDPRVGDVERLLSYARTLQQSASNEDAAR